MSQAYVGGYCASPDLEDDLSIRDANECDSDESQRAELSDDVDVHFNVGAPAPRRVYESAAALARRRAAAVLIEELHVDDHEPPRTASGTSVSDRLRRVLSDDDHDDGDADEDGDSDDRDERRQSATRRRPAVPKAARRARAPAPAKAAQAGGTPERPMSLSRKFKELYANPDRPLESAPRRAKLAALQLNVENTLAQLSALSGFARMGGDVDAFEYEKQLAHLDDDEYLFVDDDGDDVALRDVKGERVQAVAAARADGAIQATYHRSIFQFERGADGASRPEAFEPLAWSALPGVESEAVESAASARLRAIVFERCRQTSERCCSETLAAAQRSAIDRVAEFVRSFVPRESVRTPIVRLPVAMLVEAGNASDHEVFHAHLRARLCGDWPELVYVALEPHVCTTWQRAVQAISAQILPRAWRGVLDLRTAHEWLRRTWRGRASPRVVVVLRKFSALARDVATDVLLRLESAASDMPLFRGKLAALLDVVHATADEALIGVPSRVRMRLVVEMIAMPSPALTGAAVADKLLVQANALAVLDGSARHSEPFLFGADCVAYAVRLFAHGTMDPLLFHVLTAEAVLAHVQRSAAAWLACLPRSFHVEPDSDDASMCAALSREHATFVANLPSVQRAYARDGEPAANDALLSLCVSGIGQPTTNNVVAVMPRWLTALDCARFRTALLHAVFLAMRAARLLFVSEDDLGVWWHAVAASDARWAMPAGERPLCPHATTPWINAFTELREEVQISSLRRRSSSAANSDEWTLAGLSRGELRAALARRVELLREEASAASALPLLQALLEDCAARLAALIRRGADAEGADEFGARRAARAENEARVEQLRRAALLAAKAAAGELEPLSVDAPPVAMSAAAKRKRALEMANPSFVAQEKQRRALDEARSEALSTLVDAMLFFALPIERLPMSELVVIDQCKSMRGAVNVNRAANVAKVLQRPARLLERVGSELAETEGICSAFRVYSEAGGAELNIAEWFRAFARVQWPDDDAVDVDEAFLDDAAPEQLTIPASKLHVFADALLQLQHLGIVGGIRKSRGGARTELVDRLI